MLSKGFFNGKFLTLVYLAVFLLLSTACFSLVGPAPTATHQVPYCTAGAEKLRANNSGGAIQLGAGAGVGEDLVRTPIAEWTYTASKGGHHA